MQFTKYYGNRIYGDDSFKFIYKRGEERMRENHKFMALKLFFGKFNKIAN